MTDEEFKSLLENETVHLGTGAPSSSTGKDLDLYVDQTTRKFYRKYFGEWNCAAEVVLGPFFTTGTLSWDQLKMDATLQKVFEFVDGEHGDRLLKLKPPDQAQGSKLYTLTETNGTGTWKILTSDDIDGLKEKLDNKADKNHQHQMKDVTDLQGALDGKANTDHTHESDDITDLQEKLNEKADTSHQHKKADITDLTDATDKESGLMGKDDKSNLDKLVNAIKPPIILTPPPMGEMNIDLQVKVGEDLVVDTASHKGEVYVYEGGGWVKESGGFSNPNYRYPENYEGYVSFDYQLLAVNVDSLEQFSTLSPCAFSYKWLDSSKKDITPWIPMIYPGVPEILGISERHEILGWDEDGITVHWWVTRDGLHLFWIKYLGWGDEEGYGQYQSAFPITIPNKLDCFIAYPMCNHFPSHELARVRIRTNEQGKESGVTIDSLYKDDCVYIFAIGH